MLLVYSYAVWGCMAFGGTFKYLHNYDMPQANFNSMTNSIIPWLNCILVKLGTESWLRPLKVGSSAYAFLQLCCDHDNALNQHACGYYYQWLWRNGCRSKARGRYFKIYELLFVEHS